MDGKSSSNPNSKVGSVDLTRDESLQEDAEARRPGHLFTLELVADLGAALAQERRTW